MQVTLPSIKTLGKLGALGLGAGLTATYVYGQGGYATNEENDWKYPGDDLIDAFYDNGKSWSLVTDIDAPPSVIWRHVIQLGCNKAGSYSSEFLERTFARLPFFNSYELQEEWQQPDSIAPGDMMPFDFHGMSMEAVDIVPGKYLVMWGDTKNPPAAPGSFQLNFPGYENFGATWCFYTIPLKNGKTRFINHWRLGWEPGNKYTDFLMWFNMIFLGGVMARLQNTYFQRVCEFKKKEQYRSRFFRKYLGKTRRYSGPLFDDVHTQWIRFGRRNPTVKEALRAPITDDPTWPPTGPDSPWADVVNEDYFKDWTMPPFDWDEQIRQKIEKTYLPGY